MHKKNKSNMHDPLAINNNAVPASLVMEKQQSTSSDTKKMQQQQFSDSKVNRSLSVEKSLENTPKVTHSKVLPPEDTQAGQGLGLYKYSIGRGNNAIMVRSLFKNRFWWMSAEKGAEMDKVHFMWTQIKNANYMETLLCKYPHKKAGFGTKDKTV